MNRVSTLSWENLIYIADLFEFSNEKQLSLLDGEPSLHPHLIDFVAYLHQRNFHVDVFTLTQLPCNSAITIAPNMQVHERSPLHPSEKRSLYDFNHIEEIRKHFSIRN